MSLLDPDVTTLPIGSRYEGPWAEPFKGTYDLWLPIRDINGLTDATTALFRVKAKDYPQLSPDENAHRRSLLSLAEKIILAERERLLREFAKRLPEALGA